MIRGMLRVVEDFVCLEGMLMTSSKKSLILLVAIELLRDEERRNGIPRTAPPGVISVKVIWDGEV
jgi:hypothetical protein